MGVLIVAFLLKFNPISNSITTVEPFRGAQLEESVFYPLMAQSLNEQAITMYVDDSVFSNADGLIYMDPSMKLMISSEGLTECFECSSCMYNDNSLIIEKFNDEIIYTLGQDVVSYNDSAHQVSLPMRKINGKYYIGLEEVSNLLGYSYSWNSTDYEAVLFNQRAGEDVFPESYDLRSRGRTADILDQGSSATCWAYAGIGALESVLLPEEDYAFSVDAMVNNPAYSLDSRQGGEYTMAIAYLLSWSGPVLNDADGAVSKHLQEVRIPERKDYDAVKKAVFLYGGVQTSLYCTSLGNGSGSQYYNYETNSYFYNGEELPNHDIIVIGWDDNYPASKFVDGAPGNGAFICQNSWGADFGEDGVFYVSYYDSNIITQTVIYSGIEDIDNYDRIYQSDLCGWVGSIGYNRENAWMANVFQASEDVGIQAAGFYATTPNTSYEMYVVTGFEDESSLDSRVLVATGTLKDAGYYTIDFGRQLPVSIGDNFAIVMNISSPGSVHPVAVEYAADDRTYNVTLADGRGYISSDGDRWESTEETAGANVCLKAYGVVSK